MVVEALRSLVPGVGEASLAVLRAPGVNLVDEALPALINELADVSEQFVLVLDDPGKDGVRALATRPLTT